jgi:hypothetical protein
VDEFEYPYMEGQDIQKWVICPRSPELHRFTYKSFLDVKLEVISK